MDNFRRYRPQSHGRNGSTDGFVNRTHGSGPRPVQRTAGGQQPATRRIGDFRAADGFHPVGHRTHHSNASAATHAASRPVTRAASGRIKLDMPDSGPMKQRRFRFLPRPYNPFKPSNWSKKRFFRTCGVLTVLAVLVGGFLVGNAYLKTKKIFKGGGNAAALQEEVDPAKLRGEGDGRVNILLLGRGGVGHEGADLTDTILIASIDPLQKEAALLSIPRDLYVRSSGGGYSKINAVFANAKSSSLASAGRNASNREQQATDAGFKAVEDIIQSKIGIPIHYHAMIDFEGFKKAIDTVGGVDVNVGPTNTVYELMRIDGRRYVLDVKEGPQHFDGLKALAYSRSRYTSARGDFDRSERQRLILVALKNKIFSAGTFGNPAKINALMNDFGNHIQTNLSTTEVMRLYDIGKGMDSGKIASVGLADPPNNYLTTDNIGGLSVVVPRAGVDNYKEIQGFVRNRLRDSFLASENASVAILNGTEIAGLATKTAEDLRSYGYNVTQVGDAPTKTYQQTTLIDLRNGTKKYTKRYLENRFKATSAGTLPDATINPGSADFVIILGQNEQARLQN